MPKHNPTVPKTFWKLHVWPSKLFWSMSWTCPKSISYHIMSCNIMSYDMISYDIIRYHILSYHIIWYHIIWYDIMWYHIVWYYMIWHIMLGCQMIWYYMVWWHIGSGRGCRRGCGLAMQGRTWNCFQELYIGKMTLYQDPDRHCLSNLSNIWRRIQIPAL